MPGFAICQAKGQMNSFPSANTQRFQFGKSRVGVFDSTAPKELDHKYEQNAPRPERLKTRFTGDAQCRLKFSENR